MRAAPQPDDGDVVALIARLRRLDIQLWADGSRLRCSAPPGALTPALRAALAAHKDALLAFLQRAAAPHDLPLPAPSPRAVPRADAPLSFAQEQLWLVEQLAPGLPTYHIPAGVRLRGRLHVAALRAGLRDLIARHQVLRTTIALADGRPVQRLGPPRAVLPLLDLAGLPGAARDRALAALADRAARDPFELSRGPLLRAGLVRLAADEHVLLLTLHHIIADGWSVGLLIGELAAHYAARADGRAAELPPLRLHYADYAAWQRDWLGGAVRAAQLAYWRRQLDGVTTLNLPADRARPAIQTYRGALVAVRLPARLTERLRDLSGQAGATLFMTLFGAFATLLARYSGQDDITIGAPIAGRTHVELEPLIGLFVNTLALRADLSGRPSFREILRRVREVALGAFAHQDLPFELLVEDLRPARDASYAPLFQAAFALQNTPSAPLALGDLEIAPLDIEHRTAKFDLGMALEEYGDELAGGVEYNTDLFDATTIARMAAHFRTLLEAIVAAPDLPYARLPLLSRAERSQILREWNDTFVAHPPHHAIHELVAEQARARPDAIAVAAPGGCLSYRELARRAAALAVRLRAIGVGPETPVAVLVARSPATAVGALGIAWAGGALLPLDPSWPDERIRAIVAESRGSALLTQPELSGRVAGLPAQIVLIDAARDALDAGPPQRPAPATDPQNLAYLIYTSGSTGRPKGIAATHAGLANLVRWYWRAYDLSPDDRVGHVAGPAFDVALLDLWACLARGACLIVANDESRLAPGPLLRWLAEQAVTIACVATPLTELMLQDPQPRGLRLRYLVSGGDKLRRRPPASLPYTLTDNYGPAESTIITTWTPVARAPQSIGRPIDNARVYVLNAELEPAPIGAPGELCIAGCGVARGYRDRPDLTAAAFLPNPFIQGSGVSGQGSDPDSRSPIPAPRLYRTGDLARWRPDGALEFLGRIDRQVKIRGFRVELGEVEAALLAHPALREAAVLVREDAPGDARLVAYVVPHQGSGVRGQGSGAAAGDDLIPDPRFLIPGLRAFLEARLPSSMIPSAFVAIDRLPRTPNGKLDRRALPQPDQPGAAVAPRDALEMQLVLLWEQVLRRGPIGVTDDFFALGGHSLSAVGLMRAIRDSLGRDLPAGALFRAPTIEQLALALRRADDRPASPLVAIRPAGARPPMFWVHPVGGNVLCYLPLARRLPAEQPLYAIESPGLHDASARDDEIPGMAARYIDAIRAVQPDGPYLLGGWSMGGVVAFEMAQQLVGRGCAVRLVALIDSWPPGAAQDAEADDGDLLAHFFADVLGGSGQALPEADAQALDQPGADRLGAALEAAKRLNIAPEAMDHATAGALFEVFAANRRAVLRYDPRPYPGDLLLIQAGDAPARPDDAARGWAALSAGRIATAVIPGDHYTIMQEPHVAALAERIERRLADIYREASNKEGQ